MTQVIWQARLRRQTSSDKSNDATSTHLRRAEHLWRQLLRAAMHARKSQPSRKLVPSSLVALWACVALSGAHAGDTTTFTCDALGRLVQSQVSGGVRHGVQQSYQYDSATNRTYLNTLGPANPRPAPVTPSSTSVSTMGGGATLSVNVGGSSPTGTVTFAIDGMFVASAQVVNGQARGSIVGLQPGTYTVTATYSGDGNNDPTTATFVVQVRDLSWLPAILQMLLAD